MWDKHRVQKGLGLPRAWLAPAFLPAVPPRMPGNPVSVSPRVSPGSHLNTKPLNSTHVLTHT